MQTCGSNQYKGKQEWAMNSAGQISLLQSHGKSCIDTDATGSYRSALPATMTFKTPAAAVVLLSLATSH